MNTVGNIGRQDSFHVELRFHPHRSADAANVGVAVDFTVVHAGKDLAVHIFVGIKVRNILHYAQLHIPGQGVCEHGQNIAVMRVYTAHVSCETG